MKVVASVVAKKYPSSPRDWEAGTTGTESTCRRFTIDSPPAYMYGFTATTTIDGTFTAGAHCDLDGDTNPIAFEIVGAATNGEARFAAAIQATNPEEWSGATVRKRPPTDGGLFRFPHSAHARSKSTRAGGARRARSC